MSNEDSRCAGCGRHFTGARGLRSHQTARFVALACRPVGYVPQAQRPVALTIRMESALISGYDAGVYADGSGTRTVVADLRTVKALDRRGLITWRAYEERGRTHHPRPYLSARGRAEAKRLQEKWRS
jgi:hypothetical protein